MLIGCGQEPAKTDVASRKIKVVATIGMLGDAIKEIGGDRVDVESLMGPGTDPHLYKATAGDVAKLDEADLVVALGLDLEGRMVEVLEKIGQSGGRTLLAGDAIPKEKLIVTTSSHGRPDPHVWFDLDLWEIVCQSIADELVKMDPGNEAGYRQRSRAYIGKVLETKSWTAEQISSIPASQRILITAHDAFHYFGKAFGMEVMGIQGTSTVTEAGASKIQELSDLIAKKNIKAIFVESSVPPNTVTALQRAVSSRGATVEIGGELFSDAMGDPSTEEGTYIGMVRHNVSTIVEALK